MPLPLAVPLIAGAASLIGSGMQARSQQNAQTQAIMAQMARQQQIDGMTRGFQSRGPNGEWLQGQDSPWETQLANFFQNMQTRQAGQFTPERLTANALDPSLINTNRFDRNAGGGTELPSWIGGGPANDITMGDRYMDFSRLSNPNAFNGATNSSQDALMQLIRGGSGGTATAGVASGVGIGGLDMGRWAVDVDPITGEVSQRARGSMESLVDDGNNFDGTALNSALTAQSDRDIERQALLTQGSAGSMGQRFGTVLNAQEGRQRGDMQLASNLQRQQAAAASFEAAQARRLGAAQNLTAQDQILMNVRMQNQGNMIQQGGMNLDAVVAGRGQDASVASSNAGINIANANNATQAGMQNAAQRLEAARALGSVQTASQGNMINGASSYNATVAQLLQSGMSSQQALAIANQRTNTDLTLGQNNFNQSNAQIAQQDNSLLAQLLGQNAQATNNMGQFNEANRLNTGQFNNTFGLDAFNANNASSQQQQQMLMQLLGMGLNQNNQRDNRALTGIGISAGVATPGANTAAGGGWGALGDAGNMAIMQYMLSRPNSSSAPISSMGNQSYPGLGINRPNVNTGLGIGPRPSMYGQLGNVDYLPGMGMTNSLGR